MQRTVASAQVFRCRLHPQVATTPGIHCLHLKLPEQPARLSRPLMRSAFLQLTAFPWLDLHSFNIYDVLHGIAVCCRYGHGSSMFYRTHSVPCLNVLTPQKMYPFWHYLSHICIVWDLHVHHICVWRPCGHVVWARVLQGMLGRVSITSLIRSYG